MTAAGGAPHPVPHGRATGGNHAQAGATVVGSRRAALGQAGPHPLRRGTAARATGARRTRTHPGDEAMPDTEPHHWWYDHEPQDADPYPLRRLAGSAGILAYIIAILAAIIGSVAAGAYAVFRWWTP